MFPLSDSTPRQRLPITNYLIIGLTIYVFLLQLASPDFESFIYRFAFIPAEFSILRIETYQFILFSIFLHGGVLHIFSNLWFLRIFGDNVEDRFGHIGFLLFYLAGGVVSVLSQYMLDQNSIVPLVGASGAISAAAGAYFVMYKRSTVRTLVVLVFGLFDIVNIPVWLFLGYWFFIQVVSGVGSIGQAGVDGGVAYMAHIGGFLFGYGVARIVDSRK